MKIIVMYSLELSNRGDSNEYTQLGDSNEYTQYTISL